MPKIWIDDREIEVGERENLIDAAARAGSTSRTSATTRGCRWPATAASASSRSRACRSCRSPATRRSRTACASAATRRSSARGRRGVLEFLLLNHPIDCPICDQAGECRLQEYYMGHGYTTRAATSTRSTSRRWWISDRWWCWTSSAASCARAVSASAKRSPRSRSCTSRSAVTNARSRPSRSGARDPYSGNVVDICPVGALLSKDFRFKSRVWWLKQADSVCASCARGATSASTTTGTGVQRIVPRPNPQVNQWWMCDRGRLDYAWINDNRLIEPVVDGAEVDLRAALDALCGKLVGLAGDFAVLLSPKLANEDLLVLRKLFRETLPAKVLAAGSLEPPAPEDDILRQADPHPNSWAVRALGLTGDAGRLLREAGTRGLVIFGDDPLRWDPALGRRWPATRSWRRRSPTPGRRPPPCGRPAASCCRSRRTPSTPVRSPTSRSSAALRAGARAMGLVAAGLRDRARDRQHAGPALLGTG